jgi:hypothetical protein
MEIELREEDAPLDLFHFHYIIACVVLDGCGDGYTLALCVYCLMVHLRNADDDAATILER